MGAAELVEAGQHLRRAQALAVDRDDVAALETEFDVLRLVRRALRRDAAQPHLVARLEPRVLELAALVGNVQQVRIHRIRRFAALLLFDRDAGGLGIGEQAFTRVQVPFAPRRDHADVRLQRVGAELEAHLVVALAGGAVGDRVGAGLGGDLD